MAQKFSGPSAGCLKYFKNEASQEDVILSGPGCFLSYWHEHA